MRSYLELLLPPRAFREPAFCNNAIKSGCAGINFNTTMEIMAAITPLVNEVCAPWLRSHTHSLSALARLVFSLYGLRFRGGVRRFTLRSGGGGTFFAQFLVITSQPAEVCAKRASWDYSSSQTFVWRRKLCAFFCSRLVGIIIVSWLRMVTAKGAGRWFFICTVAFKTLVSFLAWVLAPHLVMRCCDDAIAHNSRAGNLTSSGSNWRIGLVFSSWLCAKACEFYKVLILLFYCVYWV